MKQQRGQLTPRIQVKAQELMGREITQNELRMMPYLSYTMQNSQKLDPLKMNSSDRKIWTLWRKAKYVTGGITGVQITPEFWRIIHKIIMLGYVDIDHND